jgi:ketosteroid isomerase-like protein
MTADVDVLLASNAALNRRDVQGMLANYASDATVVDHRKVGFGTFTGHVELGELYSGIVASAASFTETVEVLVARDGVVVTHCEVTARLATAPDGPDIGAEYGYVATVRDGLIDRLELYDDGAAALQASGLRP